MKNLITNEDKEVLKEGFYEWKIKKWDELNSYALSPTFYISDCAWKLLLYPDGKNESRKGFVSYYVNSVDANQDASVNIHTRRVHYVRNYNDYSCYVCHVNSGFYTFQKKAPNVHSGFSRFIERSELYENKGNFNNCIVKNNKCIFGVFIRTYKYSEDDTKFHSFTKNHSNISWEYTQPIKEPLIEDNKCVVGIYICTYKQDHEQHEFIEKIKNLIDNENNEVLEEGFYEWKINDWDGDNDFQIISKRQENLLPGLEYFMGDSSLRDVMEDTNKLIVGVYLYVYKYEKGKNKNNEDDEDEEDEEDEEGDYPLTSVSSIKSSKQSLTDPGNHSAAIKNDHDQPDVEEEIEEIDQDEKGELALAQFNFSGQDIDHLDIESGQYYRILNRNIKDGWAFGYKSGQSQKKGIFPMAFVTICAQHPPNNTNDSVDSVEASDTLETELNDCSEKRLL
ncbi:hypothetical protein PIROE2DRAFT_64371 [Piromyces sp. E2]|nr:hypothetical protein PIROE2DRAFT_64371 [Piromyces sp. E2]|eukprot:OUM58497.1 hypothetical protein PIROE2DRAFT_64371 [Piromyces sp. E2]